MDVLLPDYLLLCQDTIRSRDLDITAVKIIDFFRPQELPYAPPRFVVLATFFRNPSIDAEDFCRLRPEYKVVLRNPSNAEFDLGTYPVREPDNKSPSIVERLVLELHDSIQFNSSGTYRFEVYGRTSESSDFMMVHARILPVIGPKKPAPIRVRQNSSLLEPEVLELENKLESK